MGEPLPFEPNLLVQHVAAQWRGLKAVWSAKLVLPAEGGAAGESWLTLTNWRLLVNDLTEHRILSPQQAAFLNRVSDHVEQKQGTPDGPLMVPLPVREGQVQLGVFPWICCSAWPTRPWRLRNRKSRPTHRLRDEPFQPRAALPNPVVSGAA